MNGNWFCGIGWHEAGDGAGGVMAGALGPAGAWAVAPMGLAALPEANADTWLYPP